MYKIFQNRRYYLKFWTRNLYHLHCNFSKTDDLAGKNIEQSGLKRLEMKRKFLFIPQNDNNVKWLFYFAPKVPSSYGFDIAWHLTFWRFARYSPALLYRCLSLKIFAKRLTTLFFCGILCPELNLTRFVSLCQFPKSFPRIAPKPSALISKTAAFAQQSVRD